MAAKPSPKPRNAAKRAPKKPARRPVLLSGGNPQIAKADGNAPVRAYIAAIPGWKREIARRLDELVSRTAPKARKASARSRRSAIFRPPSPRPSPRSRPATSPWSTYASSPVTQPT